jgi:hypothetical protein
METSWAADVDFIRKKGEWTDESGVRIQRDDVPNILQVPLEISTINEAISKARSGDVIAVSPGIYTETLVLHKSINIRLEVPPFLPIEAVRTVTIVGANGGPALRICPEPGEDPPSVLVCCYDLCFKSEGGSLLDHAIEIDGCKLQLESCEVYGGTQSLFAYNRAVVEARSSSFCNAARAGINLASGAHGLFQSCKISNNAEEGLVIVGWTAEHLPGGTEATLETSSVEHNSAFGLHVIGGAALRARGCDIRFNEQSGVHVAHAGSTCALDTCRVSDNGWYGVFAHKVFGEVPGDVTVTQSLVRRNARGSVRFHAGCHVLVERSWGVYDGASLTPEQLRLGGNSAAAADAEEDDDRVGDWLAQMGLRRLEPLFTAVRIERVRDARSVSLTDLQAMGVSDLFLRRLLVLRLARPPELD